MRRQRNGASPFLSLRHPQSLKFAPWWPALCLVAGRQSDNRFCLSSPYVLSQGHRLSTEARNGDSSKRSAAGGGTIGS
jgi:hypothetical protein